MTKSLLRYLNNVSYACAVIFGTLYFSVKLLFERFLYDLEMISREHNQKGKRTEKKQSDWFGYRRQTRVAFGLFSEDCELKVAILFHFTSLAFQHSDRSIEQAFFHIRDIF